MTGLLTVVVVVCFVCWLGYRSTPKAKCRRKGHDWESYGEPSTTVYKIVGRRGSITYHEGPIPNRDRWSFNTVALARNKVCLRCGLLLNEEALWKREYRLQQAEEHLRQEMIALRKRDEAYRKRLAEEMTKGR